MDKFQKVWESQQPQKPIKLTAQDAVRIKVAKDKEKALKRAFKGICSYKERKALFESRKIK